MNEYWLMTTLPDGTEVRLAVWPRSVVYQMTGYRP